MNKFIFKIFLMVLISTPLIMAAQSERVDLRKALNEIQSKYNVQFSFDNDLVDNVKVNNYNNWNEKLTIKLERILKPLQLTFSKIDENYYVIKKSDIQTPVTPQRNTQGNNPTSGTTSNQNTLKINGTVYDESGQTAIGVAVQIKGTQRGTITDVDGFFEIEASVGNSLIFSFIGYKTIERVITSTAPLLVNLEVEATRMEEVVVVAYGVQKRAHLTGSVASLNTAELAQKTSG